MSKLPIPLGGDGLTAKRGEEAQFARKDGPSEDARLEGVVVKVEHWHKDVMIMLKVLISLLNRTHIATSKLTLAFFKRPTSHVKALDCRPPTACSACLSK